MPAPELTLRTSGITWRTEGNGGPDNDVRLTAPGEPCVDVQRLARSTLVKISASDSPASSSASAAPNRFREAQVARRSSRRGTTGRRTVWANVWPIVVGPRILAGPRGRGHVGPDQRLPGWWSWSEAAEVRWGRHSLGWL